MTWALAVVVAIVMILLVDLHRKVDTLVRHARHQWEREARRGAQRSGGPEGRCTATRLDGQRCRRLAVAGNRCDVHREPSAPRHD